jgi:hypothetical protein
MRRAALYVMIGILAIISVAALIEFRLSPYFYLHVLQTCRHEQQNPGDGLRTLRFLPCRRSGGTSHLFWKHVRVILGMVAVLARSSGLSLKNPWVIVSLFAAFGCIITSISFTPYAGTIAGILFFSTLILIPMARKIVLPLTLLVMFALFAYTYNAATTTAG